jgi:NADP-dependent 3-hydroxy acid dehydrogenase YdfG
MTAPQPFLDKIAIVTGASSGIGRATALALAHRGAHIALASRRTALLEQAAAQIEALGRQAAIIPTDVSQQEQVEGLVERVVKRWGKVDILVSNAGEYVRSPVDELNIDIIRHALAVNYYGAVYAILAVLPHMRAQKDGHIVAVTSMDSKKGLPPDAPYVSAKFALTGFVEVLRQELHGSGVYISNILPGRVDTAMIEELEFEWISRKIPPEPVADAIVQAILKRKPEVIIPFHARLLYYANVLSPSLGDWIVRRFNLEGWVGPRSSI